MEVKDTLQEIVGRYGDRVYMAPNSEVCLPDSSFRFVDEKDCEAVCDAIRRGVRDLLGFNVDTVRALSEKEFPRKMYPEDGSTTNIDYFDEGEFSLLQEKTINDLRYPAGDLVTMYRMVLSHVMHGIVAEFIVRNTDGRFDIPHREVLPRFRNYGVGDMMLKGCEALCNENFKNTGEGEYVDVDVGQVDVLRWFIKNGYEPVSYSDAINVRMILAGAEDLCIGNDYYVFIKQKYAEMQALNVHNEPVSCEENSLRVKLRKKVA